MQFLDDHRGYGTVANKFYRSNDGGHSWEETKIPDVVFIDQLFFLTPELGWIAGSGGKDLLVFRTVNGGKDWDAHDFSATTGTGTRSVFRRSTARVAHYLEFRRGGRLCVFDS